MTSGGSTPSLAMSSKNSRSYDRARAVNSTPRSLDLQTSVIDDARRRDSRGEGRYDNGTRQVRVLRARARAVHWRQGVQASTGRNVNDAPLDDLVVDVRDVHAQRDVVPEVARQDAPHDVERQVRAARRWDAPSAGASACARRENGRAGGGKAHVQKPSPRRAHRAWPMWALSYTVGPHMYHSTWRPFMGMNGTFDRVREL